MRLVNGLDARYGARRRMRSTVLAFGDCAPKKVMCGG
jgi:hypothetical protein